MTEPKRSHKRKSPSKQRDPSSSSAAYRQASDLCGSCAIESGLVGNLADNECAHGRLPGDLTKRCGCWAEEGAVLHLVDGSQQQLFDTPAELPAIVEVKTA
jgi:hypothetical protein